MESKLDKDRLLFTDKVKTAGLTFDGANFKCEDGSGNLVGLAVKAPETADEAVNLGMITNSDYAKDISYLTTSDNITIYDGEIQPLLFTCRRVDLPDGTVDTTSELTMHLNAKVTPFAVLLRILAFGNYYNVGSASSGTIAGTNWQLPNAISRRINEVGIVIESGWQFDLCDIDKKPYSLGTQWTNNNLYLYFWSAPFESSGSAITGKIDARVSITIPMIPKLP